MVHRHQRRADALHGPEILTTVCIFGCFLGIALALLDFDASNVSASVPKLLDGVVTSLQTLQRSLSGNVEGSLLSQTKLMRQDQADQLTSLRTALDTFAQRMAKVGSQALIDALREVIADFNTKITDQFGDNFKELNQAVGKLVVWQEQYRFELDQLQRTNADISASLSDASSNLG